MSENKLQRIDDISLDYLGVMVVTYMVNPDKYMMNRIEFQWQRVTR